MKIILIHDETLIAEASALAYRNHLELRRRFPLMPEKREDEFAPRIEWMTREGRVYGLMEGDSLLAFIGWFKIDEYRNVGAAAFTPDWCLGVSAPEDKVPRLMSPLIRRLLGDLKEEGISIHALGIPSSSGAFLEEFSLLGYGRIVMDAAWKPWRSAAFTRTRPAGAQGSARPCSTAWRPPRRTAALPSCRWTARPTIPRRARFGRNGSSRFPGPSNGGSDRAGGAFFSRTQVTRTDDKTAPLFFFIPERVWGYTEQSS